MTKDEFRSECMRIFALNRLPCSAEQAEQLYELTQRMLEVNQSMNLTAITDHKAVILRHTRIPSPSQSIFRFMRL